MKKFLSLVLALVMTMSLVTVSAGAKDFTDSTKIQYTEAVDVMSAVKVIDGYTDGSFNPSATLTRGAAAKIICNLILGPTTASALVADAAPYKDVPTTNVFAGYIAYCQKEGIISGYADGTFKPANSLTGYAFMKMLLGALGYDAETEGYTGPNWSINVAKRALNIGLDDGLTGSFNGVKAVTREEACLYAFNTLQATMVEYENNNSVTVNGITFTNKSAAKDMKWVGTEKTYNDDKDGKVQFCEKYFTDLTLEKGSDAFCRPANTWKVKKDEVGTYTNRGDLVASYTKKASKADIYTAIGKTVYDDLNDSDSTLYAYVNGVGGKVAVASIKDYAEKNASGAAGASGKGVLTEVYVDDNNNVTIVSVNTYLAKATGDYNTKKESLNVEFVEINDGDSKVPAGTSATIYNDDLNVESFKEDDYLLITVSEKDTKPSIESAVKAEVLTGKVTEYTVDDYAIIGGKTISYNKLSGKGVTDVEYTINEDAKVVLDQYGYIIYVDEAVSTSSYVFIRKSDTTSNLGTKAIADAYFTDGTSEEITLKKVDGETKAATIGGNTKGWYTFTKDSDGKYTLTTAKNQPAAKDYTENTSKKIEVIKNSTVKFLDSSNVKATADTLFLVRDYDGDVTVYTGITNVPDVTIPQVATVPSPAPTIVTVTWTCTDSSKTYAEYVFIDVAEKNVDIDDVNDAADYLFLLKPTGDKTVVDGSTYYKYKVIIDGEETTKFVEETIVSGNKLGDLFTNIKENNKGYITNGKPFDGTDAKKHIENLTNGKITLKGETLDVAGKAFIVNSDADVNLIVGKDVDALLKDVDADYETYLHTSASAVASLLKGYDLNGKVYASLKDNGSEKVTALYIYISGAKESAADSKDASVKTIEVKGNDVAGLSEVKISNDDAKNTSKAVFNVVATDDGVADVKVFVADATSYAKDQWTAYSISNTEDISAWGTFYLKAVVTAKAGNTKTYTLKVTVAAASTGAMVSKNAAVKVKDSDVEIDKIYKDIITVSDLYTALDFDSNCGEFDTITVQSAFGTSLDTSSAIKVIAGMKVVFHADGQADKTYGVKFST